MTNDQQDTWQRVIDVVAAMRAEGTSLQQATRDAGISASKVLRLAGSAIRQRSGGRYVAAASDSLLRVVVIPTADGLTEVALRNSKDATLVAEYLNAVHRYLSKGDASALGTFQDVSIRSVEGERLTLVTDVVTLDRLGSAGVLSFESIYARGGGR
jgi:lambda repressor-like predicted transcriptional regulator